MMANEQPKAHRVEVWFHIEKDEDGYPESKEWEGLLCRCTDSVELFQVESVPFFVKGVAVGDVVEAKEASEGYYEYQRVVSRSGHSTYRLYIEDKAAGQVAQSDLESIGCTVESSAQGSLIAVDVPRDRKTTLREILRNGVRDGRWELQEGYLAEGD